METEPTTKLLTVVKVNPRICCICGSSDVVFHVQYRDPTKPARYTQDRNYKFPTIQKLACAQHPEHVTALVLVEAGLISADPDQK